MSAPARATNVAYVPTRDQYIPVLNRVLPGASGEEMQIRCSILATRDNAASAMQRCSDDAYPFLQAVEQLASKYAYVELPIERLRLLRKNLTMIVANASSIESLAYFMATREDSNAGE